MWRWFEQRATEQNLLCQMNLLAEPRSLQYDREAHSETWLPLVAGLVILRQVRWVLSMDA